MSRIDCRWCRLLYIVVVLYSFLVSSCQHRALQFEHRVHAWWEAKCPGLEKCNGSINELVSFQWDRMYFINWNTSEYEVDVEVGFRTGYREFNRMVIFVKDEKIVYSEQEQDPIEYGVDHSVYFEGPQENALVVMFTSSQPEFTAIRQEDSEKKHYYRVRHRE